jgi:type I restriction-modification system DNA methylase subunit
MAACDICGKEFMNTAGLKKHSKRKTPCKSSKPKEQKEPNEIETEFREISKKFNKLLSKEDRQQEGIFFTPKKARSLVFTKLKEYGVNPRKVLEPSFGSGEFLFDIQSEYPDAELFGVEKNEELFNEYFNTVECKANLTCCDFLIWEGKVDLIIANPPYFVIKSDMTAKEKKEFNQKYLISGRPNIYILFLYKCLTEHLETDGFLAFIIPTSLYNCSYYQKVRNYIQEHTTIKYVETLNKPGFYETGQETMLIIIQKNKTNDDYIFRSKSGNIYISPYYKELYDITKDTQTLTDLGLGAKTGNITWNEHKDKIGDTGKLLIYSGNIRNSELNLNISKKQYIHIDKPTIDGPVILVERGYGNSLSFNSVLVEQTDFYAENHINVIYPIIPEAVENLDRVLKSFQDERTKQFLKWFIGNGSISATDIETNIPIF